MIREFLKNTSLKLDRGLYVIDDLIDWNLADTKSYIIRLPIVLPERSFPQSLNYYRNNTQYFQLETYSLHGHGSSDCAIKNVQSRSYPDQVNGVIDIIM